MTLLPTHLFIASVGLLAASAVGLLISRGLRRRPVESYRLLVAILVAALLLPILQVGVEGRLPLAGLVAPAPPVMEDPAVAASRLESVPAPALDHDVEPEPESLSPPLPSTELEGIPTALPLPGAIGSLLLALDLGENDQAAGAAVRDARLSPGRVLLAVWGLGLLLAAVRPLRRLARTRRLLADTAEVTDRRVLGVWREIAQTSPTARRTRLLTNASLHGPVCFGGRRPRILLPPPGELAERPEMLRCVLLHELVHLERRDTRTMVLQECLRSVFWFHPGAWWLNRRLDTLRELSCDLLVVRRTGRCKRYATALVDYAALAGRRWGVGEDPAPAVLPTWTRSPGQLSRRIEMLLSIQSLSPWRTRRLALGTAGALLAFLWGGQVAFAAAVFPAPHDGDDAAHDLVPLPDVPHAEEVPERLRFPDHPLSEGFLIGVSLGHPDAELARKLEREAEDVLVIEQVHDGSLAERAGLKVHDVILSIDGDDDADLAALTASKKRLAAGEKVRLAVLRGGKVVEVVLGDGGRFPNRWRPADERSEKQKRAVELLEKAMQLDPENASIRRALESVQGANVLREALERGRQGLERGRRELEHDEDMGARLYDAARRYYETIDADGLRRELEKGLQHHRQLLEEGHLNEAGREYWDRVRGLYEKGEFETYLEKAREHLESKPAREIQKEIRELYRRLDPQTREYVEQRWLPGARQRSKDYNPFNELKDTTAPDRIRDFTRQEGREAELSARVKALEAELDGARELLDRSRAEIGELRKEIRNLARMLETR